MGITYSTIRDDLKTGDLVLFSGKGGFCDIIKSVTSSHWSHIGMILKLEEYDFLTVWESTIAYINDLESKTPTRGVQLAALSDRVKKYSGAISVRKLKGGKLSENSVKKLMILREQLKGKKYERNTIELFKAAYDGPWGDNSEDLSSIFCSELVAEAYQALDLLSDEKFSNEYTPADFSEKRMKDLLGGFYLSEEIKIT